jgi:hypothetical protein
MKKGPFKHLIPGKQYKVARIFLDYDGKPYEVGDTYTFLGTSFLPYDDGLTLYFSQALDKVTVRLQWREVAQKDIIDNLKDYFVKVERS